eukprot:Em0005g291a
MPLSVLICNLDQIWAFDLLYFKTSQIRVGNRLGPLSTRQRNFIRRIARLVSQIILAVKLDNVLESARACYKAEREKKRDAERERYQAENAKAIKQSQKRNALLKCNCIGRVLARRKECDTGSPRASENTNEAFERILPRKLPKVIELDASISDLLVKISKSAHILFVCFRGAGSKFIPTVLYHDTQAFVQTVFWNIIKLQVFGQEQAHHIHQQDEEPEQVEASAHEPDTNDEEYMCNDDHLDDHDNDGIQGSILSPLTVLSELLDCQVTCGYVHISNISSRQTSTKGTLFSVPSMTPDQPAGGDSSGRFRRQITVAAPKAIPFAMAAGGVFGQFPPPAKYTLPMSADFPYRGFNSVTTWWTGSGFQCPSYAGSSVNTITLSQPAGGPLNTVPGSCGNLSAVMTNISGTCYTSVFTIPTPLYLNGTTVACRDGITGSVIGNDTLNIQLASPPSAPTITSLISTSSDRLTVAWTSVRTATNYNVGINDSVIAAISIDSPSYTWICIGLTNNTVYTVSVVAINCAGSSSPATMTGRTGPSMPAAGPCTATVGTAVGIAIGVSVSVTFVVSFSMGVLVASVLCYISRRSKESSHKPSSYADPTTVYDEVGTNKKRKEDAMEMSTNTAYGTHISINTE